VTLGELSQFNRTARFVSTAKRTWGSENSACLTVNARNALGGYTGDQQAMLFKEKEIWRLDSISMESHAEFLREISTRLSDCALNKGSIPGGIAVQFEERMPQQ